MVRNVRKWQAFLFSIYLLQPIQSSSQIFMPLNGSTQSLTITDAKLDEVEKQLRQSIKMSDTDLERSMAERSLAGVLSERARRLVEKGGDKLSMKATYQEIEAIYRRIYLRGKVDKQMFWQSNEVGLLMADAIADQGRLTEAVKLRSEIISSIEQDVRSNGDSASGEQDRTTSYSLVLPILERMGNYDLAAKLYKYLLNSVSGTFGSTDYRAHLLNCLLHLPGPHPEMKELANVVAEDVAARRLKADKSPIYDMQIATETAGINEALKLTIDASWQSGRSANISMPEQDFRSLQGSMEGEAGRAVALMAARASASSNSDELGNLAKRRQDLVAEWRKNQSQQTRAFGAANAAENLFGLQNRKVQIERELDFIDTEFSGKFPRYYQLVRPEPLTIAQAQSVLSDDEAAVIIVPTALGTHVVALTRTRLLWTRAAWSEEQVNAAVAKLRSDLDGSGGRGGRRSLAAAKRTAGSLDDDVGLRSFDRKTAHELYIQVISPVASILKGKRHVFIAADGALSNLPFGVFVTEAPTGDDDDPEALRNTHWLADTFALIQIPTLQSLQALRNSASDTRSTSLKAGMHLTFAGYGDPILDGVAISRSGNVTIPALTTDRAFRATSSANGVGVADTKALRGLARLPGTAVELEKTREALGAPVSSLHLGADNTESRFKETDFSGIKVIDLATHGLLASEVSRFSPGVAEPGLVFTPPATGTAKDDGLLTASEISLLKLDADWVILSACNTAAGGKPGERSGLSGLARSFFYAGAKTLLASHWPVRDDVASTLTVDAIRRKERDPRLSRAEAFQQAERAIRNNIADPTLAHPTAWAPFSLVGDGAR